MMVYTERAVDVLGVWVSYLASRGVGEMEVTVGVPGEPVGVGVPVSAQHPAPRLMPLAEPSKDYDKRPMVPFSYRGYLVLVDWAGRIKHPHKRGVIKAKEPALLEKLGLSPEHWRRLELEIAKEASTMLNGLEFAERFSQRSSKEPA